MHSTHFQCSHRSLSLPPLARSFLTPQEGFPISTTQCITGATVGVGLANGACTLLGRASLAPLVLGRQWRLTTLVHQRPHHYPFQPPSLSVFSTQSLYTIAGEWRAVNWKLFARIFASWVITLPAAGTMAGLIFAFTAYAPSIAHNPTAI